MNETVSPGSWVTLYYAVLGCCVCIWLSNASALYHRVWERVRVTGEIVPSTSVRRVAMWPFVCGQVAASGDKVSVNSSL